MKGARIALVEIGGSHDECLLTQINALKSVDAQIFLICDKTVKQRLAYLSDTFTGTYEVNTTGAALGDFLLMRRMMKFLKANRIEKVVFNTAQGGHVRNLRFLMPKSITCYGVVHTIRKFNQSKTQQVIHKMIHRYVVLSDDLLERTKKQPGIHVGSFYPIDFYTPKNTVEKPGEEVRIAIPGGLESRRKDMSRLVEMIASTPENVRFFFLGRTDAAREDVSAFLQQLEEKQLQQRVHYFTEYLSDEQFFGTLRSCDFIMPLIHPDTPSSDEYPYQQISGSFNLSYGLKIPLLIHEAYQGIADLQTSSAFYTIETFEKDLALGRKKQTNIIVEIGGVEKWKTNVQHTNYLQFLELI